MTTADWKCSAGSEAYPRSRTEASNSFSHPAGKGSRDHVPVLRVSIVVTNETAGVGLLAMSADDFAGHLWTLMPDDVNETISALAAKRTKRPVTAEELMEAMRNAFPTMVNTWLAGRA